MKKTSSFAEIETLLTILQQEEYNRERFKSWLQKHSHPEKVNLDQSLVWTPKAAVLFLLSIIHNAFTGGKKPASAVTASVQILAPLDGVIKTILTRLAKIKLKLIKLMQSKEEQLIVVGITGSYGKTSTKLILEQILEKTFNTLATPESYNTLMGIAKVILKNLNRQHRVFLVEMGAYDRGEIARICRLVKPQLGIITAVGPMHLERFGSLDNIKRAKFELIQSLPQKGIAVFNGDNQIAVELAKKTNLNKSIYKSIPGTKPGAGEIIIKQDNQEIRFSVKSSLLGKHQLSNLAAASSVALRLGLQIEKIQLASSKLNPAPHRLQLMDPGTGVLIIDDTYSSNPAGFQAALSVLDKFKDRRKVLVTPGMVELGDKEMKSHFEVGQVAAEICDIVILVGKTPRTLAFQKGLSDMGFNSENLFLANNSEKAQEKLGNLSRPLDVILLENDLPDKYL